MTTNQKKKKREKKWWTRRKAAELLSISEATLDRSIRPLLSPAESKIVDGALRLDPTAAIKALIQHRISVVERTKSPELERLRRAIAEEKEQLLGIRRGDFLLKDEVLPEFLRAADILKRTNMLLQRRFGPDASKIVNGGLDQWVEEFAKWVKEKYRDDQRSDHARDKTKQQ